MSEVKWQIARAKDTASNFRKKLDTIVTAIKANDTSTVEKLVAEHDKLIERENEDFKKFIANL